MVSISATSHYPNTMDTKAHPLPEEDSIVGCVLLMLNAESGGEGLNGRFLPKKCDKSY